MNKHSVSMVVIPPIVTALIGATGVGIFIAASAAAMGVRAWWIDGAMGFGVALFVVYGIGLLLWLGFLYPREKEMVAHEQVIDTRPRLARDVKENILVRDPLVSIPYDKARRVAYHVLHFGAGITFLGLADLLTPKEISALQTELKTRNMAIPNRSDPQGGIELTDKGTRGLARYLSPTESFEEWQNAIPVYTHLD